MKLTQELYKQIIDVVSPFEQEVGILLGGNDDTVTVFCLDKGQNPSIGQYTPDVDAVERVTSVWAADGIRFLGLAHTHREQSTGLSAGDIRYIRAVMQALQGATDHLYFPVISGGRMTVHKATWIENQVIIRFEEDMP